VREGYSESNVRGDFVCIMENSNSQCDKQQTLLLRDRVHEKGTALSEGEPGKKRGSEADTYPKRERS